MDRKESARYLDTLQQRLPWFAFDQERFASVLDPVDQRFGMTVLPRAEQSLPGHDRNQYFTLELRRFYNGSSFTYEPIGTLAQVGMSIRALSGFSTDDAVRRMRANRGLIERVQGSGDDVLIARLTPNESTEDETLYREHRPVIIVPSLGKDGILADAENSLRAYAAQTSLFGTLRPISKTAYASRSL